MDIFKISGSSYSNLVGPEYMKNVWPNLQFQAGVVLLRNEHYCAGLGLQSFASSPALSSESRAKLQTFIPHLIQSIKIHTRINTIQQTNRNLESVLTHLQLGVVLLDSDYRIKLINPAAKNALEKIKSIHISPGSEFLQQTMQLNFIPAPKHVKTGKRHIASNTHETCIAYHTGQVKIEAFNLPSITDSSIPEGSSYLLLIRDSALPCKLPISYLQKAYGITPAENELIRYLVNGASLAEAANGRAVTKETARWQLKNILQKTRTHSQSQLSRLVLALADV